MQSTTTEATATQLHFLAEIEERAKALNKEFGSWLALLQSIADRVADDDGYAGELVDSLANDLGTVREELRRIRVARGMPALRTWLFYRIHLLKGVSHYAEDVSSEDVAMHRGLVAVEHAIAGVDPDLLAELTRAGDDDRPALMDRAEAAITKLIESGWRP
jgi:hypothetical protein